MFPIGNEKYLGIFGFVGNCCVHSEMSPRKPTSAEEKRLVALRSLRGKPGLSRSDVSRFQAAMVLVRTKFDQSERNGPSTERASAPNTFKRKVPSTGMHGHK